MIIRKLFKFESAHIVRKSVSKRCSQSIHGHSYKVEFLLKSDFLNDAGIALDFTIVKERLGAFIDAFDHSIAIWRGDSARYAEAMKDYSDRYVIMPVNPSAEQFARIFLLFASIALKRDGIKAFSAIVHETESGYAQAFEEDLENERMGIINLGDLEFSPSILSESEFIRSRGWIGG